MIFQKVKTNNTILEKKSDNDNSDINNNKNLFITKVNYLEKENKKVNKDIKILDRNNLLKKYKLKKKEDKEIKENFLDFILNENSNYADIDKIIEHYKNIELKKKNEYSNNLLIIKKKKEILNNLNMQINKVLVDNVEITDKELERFYDNEIESKKREIKLKKHELEMYHQLFNQTYKTNYKLINKLEIETKYSKIYNEQYEKYTMVKNTSLTKLRKQEEILKNLNFYFEQYATANENAINEKTKKLNKEEYEVYMIKNDIISFEKGIQKLKKRKEELILEYEKNINNYNQKNIDYILTKNQYIKDFIKMENIYHVLKVNNLDGILAKYNRLNQEYSNKSLLLKSKSIEIIDLNALLKNKNDLLKDIYNKIEEIKKEIVSRNKLKNDEEEKIIIQKRQIKLYISQIYDILKEKINTFTLCLNNALFDIHKIIESMNNALIIGPFSFKKSFTKRFDSFLNDDLKSINVDFEKEYDERKMLLFVIILIKSINYFLVMINTNIAYTIYNKIIEEKEIKKISKIEELSSFFYLSSSNILTKRVENPIIEENKNNNANKVDIYYIGSNFIQNFFEKELKHSVIKLNEKKKIYSRSAKDILKKKDIEKQNKKNNKSQDDEDDYLSFINKIDEPLNDSVKNSTFNSNISKSKKNKNKKYSVSQNKFIAKEDFIKLYFDHYQKCLNNKKFKYIKMPNIKYNSFYTNRFSFMNEFINDQVSDKIYKEKLDNEKREKIRKMTKKIKAKIEEKELNNFILKKKNE